LPIRIHDLAPEDIKLIESRLGFIRSVDFIYKSAGVNRPLRAHEDHPQDNLNKTYYRDQINKVANAIDEIMNGLKGVKTSFLEEKVHPADITEIKEKFYEKPVREKRIKPRLKIHFEKNKPRILAKYFKKIKIIVIVSLVLILSFFSIRFYYVQKKRNYARIELIPQIQKMTEENYTAPLRAFELATEAEKYISGDSVLIKLWPKISGISSLQTQPEGARVFWKDYNKPKDPWKSLGITPLKNVRTPWGYKRIKIEKDGFNTIFLTTLGLLGKGPERFVKLDSTGVLPENMVRIPSQIASMNIVGLESYGGKNVYEFLIDRFEITNKEFKKFVDADGYKNKDPGSLPWKDSKTRLAGKVQPAGK
jgi:hypothetical protein